MMAHNNFSFPKSSVRMSGTAVITNHGYHSIFLGMVMCFNCSSLGLLWMEPERGRWTDDCEGCSCGRLTWHGVVVTDRNAERVKERIEMCEGDKLGRQLVSKTFHEHSRWRAHLANGRVAGALHHELVLCRKASKDGVVARLIHG